jgi:ADP-ribose pyrophosphatase YjhB (NUDIX family)
MAIPPGVDWAQRLQAIAQTGLSYEKTSHFDRERYLLIREIAAEMLAANGNPDIGTITALFDAQVGHATPKIDVRGVVFRERKLLLAQEKMDNHRWTLPGGWADIGESASESAVREVHEETGYSVRAVKLLALLDRNKHPHPPHAFHAYKAFFLCELTDPERHADPRNMETGAVEWFGAGEIATLELSLSRVTPQQIARLFDHHLNPDLPTDFD